MKPLSKTLRTPLRTPLPAVICIALGAAGAQSPVPALLLDVNPSGSSVPDGRLRVLGTSPRDGELIVMLDDGVHGLEPWRTDGTAAGTTLLADVTPGPAGTAIDELYAPPRSGTRWVWFVRDTAAGQELWRTDGTSAGTGLFATPAMLGGGFLSTPRADVPLGDVLFFELDAATTWRTDGTFAGTFSLGVPAASPVAIRNGIALLRSPLGDLIASDGNVATVVLSAPALELHELHDGQLLVRIPQISGTTVVGTTLLSLDPPGLPLTLPGAVSFNSLPSGYVLFHLARVLAWDGLQPPTLLRQFFFAYPYSYEPVGVRAGNRLLFGAADTVYGPETWSTDGTVAGTQVIDSVPGPLQGTLGLTRFVVNDRALLRGNLFGTPTGSELYSSDGTAAGTVLLGEVEAGPGGIQLFHGRAVHLGARRLVLPLRSAASGDELYVTDGTAGSLTMLADVLPGSAGSVPGFPDPELWNGAMAGGSLVWAANDGVHGYEPWVLPATGVRTLLRRYGERKFDVGDPVLGGALTLALRGLAPGELAVVGIALPAVTPLPFAAGRFVHLDPASAWGLAVAVPDPQGAWSTAIPLPPSPAAVGLDLVTQPVFVGPAGLDLGSAYWLTLGP